MENVPDTDRGRMRKRRMKYIKDTTEFQIEEPTIVTLGKFDGRHRGHQKLLRTMKELKDSLGYPTAIFTFGMPPLSIMSGQPSTVITTNLERRFNLEKMGIDYLVEYPFSEQTRHMEPEDFVRDILAGRMGAKEIVVGPDCSFGYKGAGNTELLKQLEKPLGYRLHVIEKEKDRMRDISSSYIREELAKGDVEKANSLLGEPYSVHGEVVHGNHIGGSVLGFPTANLSPPPAKRLPRFGVYVSRVLVDGVYYRGITNIGRKPTVEGESPVGVETYVFDMDRDIYGTVIEVQLLAFDRPEQKFSSMEELKHHIELDKVFAANYFESHPEIQVWQPGVDEKNPADPECKILVYNQPGL